MSTTTGPIVYLEHDKDDQEQLKETLQVLGIQNEMKVFEYCAAALAYLRTTTDRPFVILSDLEFPGMDGFMLREEIIKDDHLRRKAIPYIFLTDYDDKRYINKAYELQVQGYFKKENTVADYRAMIKQIVDYWKVCKHPNLQ